MKSEIEFNPNWTIQDLSQQELYILTYLYAKDHNILHYSVEDIAQEFYKEHNKSVLNYIYRAKQITHYIYKIQKGYEEYYTRNLIGSYIWKQKEK